MERRLTGPTFRLLPRGRAVRPRSRFPRTQWRLSLSSDDIRPTITATLVSNLERLQLAASWCRRWKVSCPFAAFFFWRFDILNAEGNQPNGGFALRLIPPTASRRV